MIRSIRCDAPRIRRGASPGRCALAAAAAAAHLAAPQAALAQPAARDPSVAEALFTEGRELVKAGDYATGCPKLVAALELNPTASLQINVAKCREHEGKIASAIADYRKALVLNQETTGAERRKKLDAIAQEGIRALEPRLPKLRVVVVASRRASSSKGDSSGHAGLPAGTQVVRDGEALPAATLGTALPVDPGPHALRVSAPGYQTESRSITLGEGETEDVEITLVPASKASRDPEGERGEVPAWVWVTGGAGLVLTGAGVYFLADDLSAISALREHCPTDAAGVTTCDQGYDYDADNARKNRDFPLFVGLAGAGVVATGVAVFGLVTSRAPKAPAMGFLVSPWVAPGGGGAGLSGRF